MIEQGVVRVVEGERAEVVIGPVPGDSCQSCGSCSELPVGRVLEVDRIEGLAPGRKVLVETVERSELIPALVVFLLPVLSLLLGAGVGGFIARGLGWELGSSVLPQSIGALLFLAIAIWIIRSYDRGYTRRQRRPRILRIER